MASENIVVKVNAELANAKELTSSIATAAENGMIVLSKKNSRSFSQAKQNTKTAESLLGNESTFKQGLALLSDTFNQLSKILLSVVPNTEVVSEEFKKMSQQVAITEANLRKALQTQSEFDAKWSRSQKGTFVRRKNDIQDSEFTAISKNSGVGVAVLKSKRNTAAIAGAARDAYTDSLDTDKPLNIDSINQSLLALGVQIDKITNKLIFTNKDVNQKSLQKQYDAIGANVVKATSANDVAQEAFEKIDKTAGAVTISAGNSSFNITDATVEATNSKNVLDKIQIDQTKTQNTNKDNNQDEADSAEETADALNKVTDSTKQYNQAQTVANTTVGKAVSTFFGYQMVLRQLRVIWNRAITTITELDKQLTSQAIVTDLTRQETWDLVGSYQKLADATGFTTTQIASVTTEYLKQGESVKNALTLTEAAAKAAQVAGISATDSVQYLTTAIHGFRLEASDALAVSDKFAALAADSATDYDELAIALSKVASQANLAGMSMDYTLALLTTGLDITQEAGESIGTALKTVIARMREISDYGETLEDGSTINDVEEALNVIGVKLRDQNGELRSTGDVLDEIGNKWDTLSSNQQAAVAKALAGTRQQSRLVAILDNYDKVIKYQEEAVDSVGATNAQMQEYLEGMQAAQNKLTVAFEKLVTAFTDNNVIKEFINKGSEVINAFTKFFNSASGKVALITGLTSLLMNFGGMTKVQSTFGNILAIVRQLITGEKEITAENVKQTGEIEKQSAELNNKKSAITDVAPINANLSTLRNQYEESQGYVKASGKNVINSFFSPGFGWKDRFTSSLYTLKANRATSKERKKALDTATSEQSDATKVLAEYKKQSKEISEENLAYETKINEIKKQQKSDAFKENEQSVVTAAHNQKLAAIQARYSQLTFEKSGAAAALQQQVSAGVISDTTRQKVLSESLVNDTKSITEIVTNEGLTTEQKIAALRKGGLSDEQVAAQTKNMKASKADFGQKAQGLASKVGGVMQIVSALSTIFTMFENAVKSYDSALEEAVETKKTQANEIESQIYEQAHQRSTLKTLISDFKDLDAQVVKSADYMDKMDEVRQNLIDSLGLDEEQAKNMSTAALKDQAVAKTTELDTDIEKNVNKLSDTLTKASGTVDWGGNILSGAGVGAAAGAGLGAGVGLVTGGAFSPVLAAAGTAVGALAGLTTGLIKSFQEKKAKEDNIAQINKLLEDDDGVNQMQTLLEYRYKDLVDVTTSEGQKLSDAVKSSYTTIVESMDADELKAALEKFDYNTEELVAAIENVLIENSEATVALNDEDSTYAEKIAAAKQIYEDMITEVGQVEADKWKEMYASFFSMDKALGDSVQYADKFSWSLSSISDLAASLGDKSKEIFTQIGEALSLDDPSARTAALSDAMSGLTVKEADLADQMITGGRDFLDLADDITSASSKVQSVRDTQAKWSTMSATDQSEWLNDNMGLFMTDGNWDQSKFDNFLNGGDLTNMIGQYRGDTLDSLMSDAETQLTSKQSWLSRYEQELATTTDEATREELKTKIANTQGEIAILENNIKTLPDMYDLSLEDIQSQEQEQISAMKEMYQQQEEDLEDSLNRRKDAYQKYFDAINAAYDEQDYAKQRDQYISSIGKLSAGTDATSQNKVNTLKQQLKQLEDDRQKTRREDAQQAVLDNIDDQLDKIQEYYDKFLDNDTAILNSMNSQTKVQYMQYMHDIGKTSTEIEAWEKSNGNLLSYRLGTNGSYAQSVIDSITKSSGLGANDVTEKLNTAANGIDYLDFENIMNNWDEFSQEWTKKFTKDESGNTVYNLNGTSVTLSAKEVDILTALMQAIQTRTGH